jgi:hypothetical protein
MKDLINFFLKIMMAVIFILFVGLILASINLILYSFLESDYAGIGTVIIFFLFMKKIFNAAEKKSLSIVENISFWITKLFCSIEEKKYNKIDSILFEELNPERYIKLIEKNYKVKDTPTMYVLGYLNNGNMEKAYEILKNINVENQFFNIKYEIYIFQSLVLIEMGKWKEALDIYIEYIKYNKNYIYIKDKNTNLSLEDLEAYLFNNNEKMIEYLTKKLKTETKKIVIVKAKYQLGICKEKAGKIEEAIELYKEVVETGNKLYIVQESQKKLEDLI